MFERKSKVKEVRKLMKICKLKRFVGWRKRVNKEGRKQKENMRIELWEGRKRENGKANK